MTTDIVGKDSAHAIRLDAEATAEVKKSRLHRKVATTIFFESNGGQLRGEATLPEVRLATAEPGLTIGAVDQCMETLVDHCYYLTAEGTRYRFSFQPNLNKLLADRRASVSATAIEEHIRAAIQKSFIAHPNMERVFFPQQSNHVPDRPALTLVVLPPDLRAQDAAARELITVMTKECGTSARTFKSALVWCTAEDAGAINEEARKLLAWKDILNDEGQHFEAAQQRQLSENVKKSERDLHDAVWRAYRNIFLLNADNSLRHIDLGLSHPSADSFIGIIISRLKENDLAVAEAGAKYLSPAYWPPALPEWSTKSVRNAFYASPKFPRLLNPDAVKTTIAKGLASGAIAYVSKKADGSYDQFIFQSAFPAAEIEISDEAFIISRERAESYLAQQSALHTREDLTATISGTGSTAGSETYSSAAVSGVHYGESMPQRNDCSTQKGQTLTPTGAIQRPLELSPTATLAGFTWTGEIPPQKWMNFYTKVLTRFVTAGGLKLTLSVEVMPSAGVAASKLEETKVALRELGLAEEVEVKPRED